MKISEIEYRIALYIDLENGDELDFYFDDFNEMNEFIRCHKCSHDYQNCKVSYTLLEVSDKGKYGALEWGPVEIEFEEFSADRITEEIEDQENFLDQILFDRTSFDTKNKSIRYQSESADYQTKFSRLKDFTYVCPLCIREINDCRCDSFPYFAIQLDTLMVPIIRLLNSKGYVTKWCCAGHIEDRKDFLDIYIAFDKEYNFNEPFPENSHYYKSGHSLHMNPPEDCTDLENFQRHALWELEDWADMLSDLYEDDSYMYEE